MRISYYKLGVKHRLPLPIMEIAGQYNPQPEYFHSVIPVGIAFLPANPNNSRIWIHLMENVDAYFYKLAFAQILPEDKCSFLAMLDLTSQVFPLCCYRVETIDVPDNQMSPFFKDECERMQVSYINVSRALYIEIYGRN